MGWAGAEGFTAAPAVLLVSVDRDSAGPAKILQDLPDESLSRAAELLHEIARSPVYTKGEGEVGNWS